MNTKRSHDHEEEQANQGVGSSKPRRNDWIADISNNDSPIKSEREQSETGNGTEELVDKHIVWSNPSNPAEEGETSKDPAREPVPDKGTKANIQEEAIPGDSPSVCKNRVRRGVVM